MELMEKFQDGTCGMSRLFCRQPEDGSSLACARSRRRSRLRGSGDFTGAGTLLSMGIKAGAAFWKRSRGSRMGSVNGDRAVSGEGKRG